MPEPSVRPTESDPFLRRLLGQMIASLPDRPRMMVILRYQEDCSADEIAGLLEIPVGTVKSTLQRAVGLLKKKMQRHCGEVRS